MDLDYQSTFQVWTTVKENFIWEWVNNFKYHQWSENTCTYNETQNAPRCQQTIEKHHISAINKRTELCCVILSKMLAYWNSFLSLESSTRYENAYCWFLISIQTSTIYSWVVSKLCQKGSVSEDRNSRHLTLCKAIIFGPGFYQGAFSSISTFNWFEQS